MTSRKFGASKLITAIKANDLKNVIAALNDGDDIEEADIHGFRGLPLRTACFSGNLEIIRHLLDCGADVNAKTANGAGAPLRSALRAGHRQIAALILSHDAEIPADVLIDPDLRSLASAIKNGTETLQAPPCIPGMKVPEERPDLEFRPPEPVVVEKKETSIADFLSSLPEHLMEEVNLKGGFYGVDTNILTMDFEQSEERWKKPGESSADSPEENPPPPKGGFWKSGS